MVAPFIVPASHPLYSVSGVYNAIFVKGSEIGDVMFYGSGAGKLPTACAVVSDVVDAAKHIDKHIYTFWSEEKLELTGIKDATRSFFVRVKGDRTGRESEIKSAFGDVRYIEPSGVSGEFGFVTPVMAEKEFDEKLSGIDGVLGRIRMESN